MHTHLSTSGHMRGIAISERYTISNTAPLIGVSISTSGVSLRAILGIHNRLFDVLIRGWRVWISTLRCVGPCLNPLLVCSFDMLYSR